MWKLLQSNVPWQNSKVRLQPVIQIAKKFEEDFQYVVIKRVYGPQS